MVTMVICSLCVYVWLSVAMGSKKEATSLIGNIKVFWTFLICCLNVMNIAVNCSGQQIFHNQM